MGFLRYDEPVPVGQPRKRIAKTFYGNKKDALAERARLQGLAKRGIATANRGKISFAKFCDDWIEHRRALVSTADDDDDEVAAATFDADRRRVKNHIIPVLGTTALETLVRATSSAQKRFGKIDRTRCIRSAP